ncbi:MAG: type IX secretion system membrane protein PorP/SprF [Bacteroidetes bacterium]|nr:type IX secretion system membrane protein PorP/SprF [Bacteroidota bacterium]
MRKFLLLVLVLFCGGWVAGQQNPMFTKYSFNTLTYNPAFAGAYDHMYISLLHRTQWVEINGAPHTQSFTFHTPLKNDRVGVGLNIVNDIIGPTHSTGANLSYAYRIPLGEKTRLSIGIQAGIMNWKADWSKLNLDDISDPSFVNLRPTMWMPNFGAGLYLNTERFFFGVSVPQLVEYDLRDENIDTEVWARTVRHYFASMGYAIPLKGNDLILRPTLLIKNVGLFSELSKDEAFKNIGAPTEFDFDLALIFYEQFWLGASFRSAIEAFDNERSSYDSADIWVSYILKNGLRIGAAYDYPLTELSQVTSGAFELMLGYEFNYKERKTVTPRYF